MFLNKKHFLILFILMSFSLKGYSQDINIYTLNRYFNDYIIYLGKEKPREFILKKYDEYRNELLKVEYFDSKKNYIPLPYKDTFKYDLTKRNFKNDINSIVNKTSFNEYQENNLTRIKLNWEYLSPLLSNKNFDGVCKLSISINKFYSNGIKYIGDSTSEKTPIDSLEINYSYNYPKKIDSIIVDFSVLKSKKINQNIYIEKLSKNGVIIDFKNEIKDNFIYLKTFDKNGKELYLRSYSSFYGSLSTKIFLNDFLLFYYKLKKQKNISDHYNLDFLNEIFCISPKTKNIILYFSKERIYENKTKIIMKK